MHSYRGISVPVINAASLMPKAFNVCTYAQDVSVMEPLKGRKLN